MLHFPKISITTFFTWWSLGRSHQANYDCSKTLPIHHHEKGMFINWGTAFYPPDYISTQQSKRRKICHTVFPSLGERSISSDFVSCKRKSLKCKLGIKICGITMAWSHCFSAIQFGYYRFGSYIFWSWRWAYCSLNCWYYGGDWEILFKVID